MKSIKQEDCGECLSAVAAFYTEDFDPAKLKLHLDVLSSNFPADSRNSVTVIVVREYILTLSVEERQLISEVVTLLQLILVMPATNASSERSFSALEG